MINYHDRLGFLCSSRGCTPRISLIAHSRGQFPLCPPLSPGNLVEDKVTLISQKVQCHVYAVHLFIYISNKSKYLKTEMRYARAVKTNLCNFERSFK